MAATDSTIVPGQVAAHDITLTANTVDSVTFTNDNEAPVEILSDGTVAIYVTTDGSTPTVSGANCYVVPASGGPPITVKIAAQVNSVVQLISTGAPVYSVYNAPF